MGGVVELAIYRSRVQALAGHYFVVALGKLHTLVASVTKQYNLVLVNELLRSARLER